MKKILDKVFNLVSFKFFLGSLFFVLLFFTFSFTSLGASSQTYFPFVRNQNGTIPEHFINKIDSVYGETYYYLIGNYHSRGNPYDDGEWVPLLLVPKSNGVPLGSVQSNEYTFTVSSATISNNTGVVFGIYWRNNRSNNSYNFGSYSGDNSRFANQQSPIYSNTKDFYGNFNLYDINSDKAIMLDVPLIVLPDGSDPVAPDLNSLDLDSSLNTSNPPSSPTYSNSFNEPLPTYDSSAPFSSLFDIVLWGFNRVHSLFQSFREFLFSWLGYFINMLTYLIQKIIDAIKYVIQWLYNQFLNWLTPYLKIFNFISGLLFNEDEQLSVFDVLFQLLIFLVNWLGDFWSNSFLSDFWNNFLSNLSDVLTFFRVVISLGTSNNEFSLITLFSNVIRILFIPDPDDLSDLLVSHDIYGLLDFAEFIQTNINYIKSLLTVNTRYVSYKFTVPDVTIMGVQCGSFDIDFSWYLNYKNVGDPIISAFLIFGWFLWIHARLPYWLRGQQGDVIGFTKEVQK